MQNAPITGRNVTTTLTPISGGAGSGEPPSPRQWVEIQPMVRQLYVVDKLPLKTVRDIIERRFNFRASERMYKDRLKRWGYSKNSKREDWLAVAQLDRDRDSTKNTVFLVHGKSRTRKDLQKYIRSLRTTREEFLASGRVDVPDYIRCHTPESDAQTHKRSPSESSSNCFSTPSPKQDGSSCVSFGNRRGTMRESPSRALLWHSPADDIPRLEPYTTPQLENSPQSDNSFSMSWALTSSTAATSVREGTEHTCTPHRRSPCPLEYEVEVLGYQVVQPASLQPRHSIEDFQSWSVVNSIAEGEHQLSCGECSQPWSMHFKSLDSLVPASCQPVSDVEDGYCVIPPTPHGEGAWTWVARCFAASIQLRKGNTELAEMALRDACTEFEKLLRRKDPMLLTAAGQMITILHQHNQGPIARQILFSAALEPATRLLDPSDPIFVTVQYLTYSSNLALTGCGITSDTLRHVHAQVLHLHGPKHPYTIASHHNYGWLLKYEAQEPQAKHKYALAEKELLGVYQTSCEIFGNHHMQSLTSLASASSAQVAQENHTEGVSNIMKVLRDGEQTLGPRHPYLLDGKRRLAQLYRRLGDLGAARGLYREVLEGRIKILGKTHPFTRIGARKDYEEVCVELGEDTDGVREEVEMMLRKSPSREGTGREGSPSGSVASEECKGF